MLKYIKQYFIFSKKERTGTFILMLVIVAVLILRFTITHQPVDQTVELEKFKKEIAAFEKAQNENQNKFIHPSEKTESGSKNFTEQKTKHEYYKFNPNNATYEDWQKFGLSDKQISVINKYISKGGKFRTKIDLKKMYTISDQKYAVLEAYIDLPERNFASADGKEKYIKGDSIQNKKTYNEPPNIIYPLELNILSRYKLTTQLNITPELAEEIVKYRNFLRGFNLTEQLLEIESMDSTTYATIKTLVEVSPKYIRKININTAESSRDLWHPYISNALQKNMFNYRQLHGDYKQVEDIKQLALINDDLYRKLAPYLTTE